MSYAVKKADNRGQTKIGWLDSKHSFSFGGYYDPSNMGFSVLRVINDDRVAPGMGFGTHPHRDMEIISYVVDGALEHKDSMGNGSIIRPGDVQRMSAGTGVRHSEFNHSKSEPVRFLQIWIPPSEAGLEPSYEQKHFELDGDFSVVVAPDGQDGAVKVHQDARILAAKPDAGQEVTYAVPDRRNTWIQVVRGSLTFDGQELVEGDGVALVDVDTITLSATTDAEVLVFDLP